MSNPFGSRWYQDEAEFSIFDYFQRGKTGNPVVAMPTGTGKSVVIANFIKRVLMQWPGQRLMMLTHVKELIEQNAERMQSVWEAAPIGIHSAGLKSRATVNPLIFGGVQSVAPSIKKSLLAPDGRPLHAKHFGFRDLVLIDECHLLSPNDEGLYQYILSELLKINPYLKVIGFTATPYRLKQGMLTDGGIFTDICYDLTTIESFNRLIAEGYMSPLIPKRTLTQIDISNVGMVGGEYNKAQLEAAVDKDETTYAAVKELVEYGYDRQSWLVFAAGIKNAEHVAAMLQSFGVVAAASHSGLSDNENRLRIEAFKRGEIRCLVNNNKLTTGFDHPPIDLIGMLRPTMSPGLWVQMLGRGTRPSPDTGKRNCLVLDFAGNTVRLGPINDPKIPGKPGQKTGDAPVRICSVCGVYNHASARNCINCGTEFSFENKLFETAGNEDLLRSDLPVVEYFDVKKVIYNLHEKKGNDGQLISPPSIKVSYFTNLQMFNEWVMLEHGGLVGKRARDWWRQRHYEEPPLTTYAALQRVSELRVPSRIRVWVNKKYPEVLSAEW
jgi:DNA repair protein RadD